MEVNSTRHIQILPVAQKAAHPLESSPRTHLQRQPVLALSEESPSSSGQPIRTAGRYEKGTLVDTYAWISGPHARRTGYRHPCCISNAWFGHL